MSEDADLDAAEIAYYGMFYNKAEVCYAASRMLVQKHIYEEILARIKKRADGTQPVLR